MYIKLDFKKSHQNISHDRDASDFSENRASLHKSASTLPLAISLKKKKSDTIANYDVPNIRIQNHSPYQSSPVVQAKLYIEELNTTISPYSQNIQEFYNDIVIPFLNQNNYRSHGILTQLRNYACKNIRFNTVDEFLVAFVNYLKGQTRNVRNGHTVPVLREFSISSMSRPAWPRDFRRQLEATAQITDDTFNIRHVIRNYTLRRALEIYEARNGMDAMAQLAKDLNVNPTHEGAYDACVRALYRALYLNTANLWMGSGIVNQIIGFLATPLQQYGQAILQGQAEYSNKILYNTMTEKTSMIHGTAARKEAIVNNLYQTILDCLGSSEDIVDIGSMLEDIGLNLGFDMIDDQSNNISHKQSLLLDAETRLQRYISSNGTIGNLLEIFNSFLHIGDIANEAFITDTEYSSNITEAEPNLALASNEANLALSNNCLIHAIATAAGMQISDETIINIRISLNDANIATIGEMLDGGDQATILIITTSLNIDLTQYSIHIIEPYNNATLAVYGTGQIPLNIFSGGNHFYSS